MGEQKTMGMASSVANSLGVTTSTLRRWAILMENAGYEFNRNERKQRVFNSRDYKVLAELHKLSKSGVSIDECVHIVVHGSQHLQKTGESAADVGDEIRISKRELNDFIQESVKEAVNAERQVMFDMFEQRLRDIMSEQKEIEQEEERPELEEPEEEKQEKKGLFSRLFKK